MLRVPFCGQRTQMPRKEAIGRYIALRLRYEDIKRLGFLVEGLTKRQFSSRVILRLPMPT